MKSLKLALSIVALIYVQLAHAECPNANRTSAAGRYDSTVASSTSNVVDSTSATAVLYQGTK